MVANACERTAHINRIKELLFGQGIRDVEPRSRRSRIDFSDVLAAEDCRFQLGCAPNSSVNMPVLTRRLRVTVAERDAADAQDPSIERKRNMLTQLRGLGPASAAILIREIFARRFANRRQLGAYLGLTPGSTTRCRVSRKLAIVSRDAL
jgi:transposase